MKHKDDFTPTCLINMCPLPLIIRYSLIHLHKSNNIKCIFILPKLFAVPGRTRIASNAVWKKMFFVRVYLLKVTMLYRKCNYNNNTVIIIIIIVIIIISFMQGIYTYISETNYVPRECSVAAILLLLFMVLISLVSVLDLLYFYISTFRSIIIIIIIFLFLLTNSRTPIKYFWTRERKRKKKENGE